MGNDLNNEVKTLGITEMTTLFQWKDNILEAARCRYCRIYSVSVSIASLLNVSILAEQEIRRKKAVMSEDEKKFLEHLLALDAFTPRQKLLFDKAEKLYGNKVKQLQPKRSLECTSGEATLVDKVLAHLQLEMEHLYESLTRLSINIGKLAGAVCL